MSQCPTVPKRVQLRHDVAANWVSADTLLLVGEFAYETDTGKAKVGDGFNRWSTLSYYGGTGPIGYQGNQGNPGIQGIQGVQGIEGPTGVQGIEGIQGKQGIQGNQGNIGSQGVQGVQGIDGPTGPQGVQGAQGSRGLQGTAGNTGSQGVQGIQGPTGPIATYKLDCGDATTNSAGLSTITSINGGLITSIQVTAKDAAVTQAFYATRNSTNNFTVRGDANKAFWWATFSQP